MKRNMKAMQCDIRKVHYLTIENDEPVIEQIKKYATEHKIKAGSVSFLGGIKKHDDGYVRVHENGKALQPTEFFKKGSVDLDSLGKYSTPDQLPYSDALGNADISIIESNPKQNILKKLVNKVRGKKTNDDKIIVHSHGSYGTFAEETNTVHNIEMKSGPYLNATILEFDGKLIRELNPKTGLMEVDRFEPYRWYEKLLGVK